MATETTETVSPPASSIRERLRNGRLARMRAPRFTAAFLTWLISTTAFLVFLGFGSVGVETGTAEGRRQRIVDTWFRFADNLPRSGHQDLLRFAFYGALAVLVVGSGLGLWLAMRADGPPPDPSPSTGSTPE